MALDRKKAIRDKLNGFDFSGLFTEELGWDWFTHDIPLQIKDKTFNLTGIAEKRNFVIAHFSEEANNIFPDDKLRKSIERAFAKQHYEHIIIFTNAKRTVQKWQWARREPGKPVVCREHTFRVGQSGEILIQKLEHLVFTIDEEERLTKEKGFTVVDVVSRVRAGFDIDRVTKKFYDRFKKEHAAFLKFLKGIPDERLEQWYVSVMLNRLMFIYFIQKKGFLDDNVNYLRDKLEQSRKSGKDRYYRLFLCPLFFEGFAKPESERSAEATRILGSVPYLNGGIFLRHQIEEKYDKKIFIADKAFDQLFAFFDDYQWHLDERPLRDEREINPDVIGYIFEKYINQKEMGAYYTKEDITDYIGKNTIIPRLFDMAREKCKVAFEGKRESGIGVSPVCVWSRTGRPLLNESGRLIYATR